jgi:transcriptional regulator with PAS, ATPase and Fis domain
MQYKKNISFSASITKSKLLLKTEYKIPEVNHLKEFIHYISSNNEANFNEIEDFSEGIFILDENFCYIEVNPKYQQLTGLDKQTILNKELFEITKQNKQHHTLKEL